MRRFLALVQPREERSTSAVKEPPAAEQRRGRALHQVDIRNTMAVTKTTSLATLADAAAAAAPSGDVTVEGAGGQAEACGKDRPKSRPNDCLVIIDPRLPPPLQPPLQPRPSRQQQQVQPKRRAASVRKRRRDSDSDDDSEGPGHEEEAVAAAAGDGASPPAEAGGSLPLDPALRLAISSLVAQVRPLMEEALRGPLEELQVLRVLHQREVGGLRVQLAALRGEVQVLRAARVAQAAEQGRVVERLTGRVEELEREARPPVCVREGEAAAAVREEGRGSSLNLVSAIRAAQAAWAEAFDKALAESG